MASPPGGGVAEPKVMATTRPHSLLDELDRLEALRDADKVGQRRFRRFVARGEVELHPTHRNRLDSTPINVQMRDLSQGGMGFLSPQPIDEGSSWRACFLREGYVIGEQAVVVRHCRQVNESLYLIGVEFVIDTGLMVQLGVSPAELEQSQFAPQDETQDTEAFKPPHQI
jgi:hypothetical protein